MEPPLSTKPIRYVLKWQALATLAIAAVAGIWAGVHGAVSAALGGVVNLSACVVYAFVLGLGKPTSAGATVVALFRADYTAPDRFRPNKPAIRCNSKKLPWASLAVNLATTDRA